MITPVSINQTSSGTTAQAQAVAAAQNKMPVSDSSAGKQTAAAAAYQLLKSDTVTVSTQARALSLYQQGLPLEQIALRLGVDVDAVRSYLGLQTQQSAAAAAQTATTASNLLQTAYQSRMDINTLRNYFGLPSGQSNTAGFQASAGLTATANGS